MGSHNGDLDTELSRLNMMDITYTLKSKVPEKQDHATSRIWYLSLQWNSGTLTHNLAELEVTSTILQICQLSCLLIDEEHLHHVHSHL